MRACRGINMIGYPFLPKILILESYNKKRKLVEILFIKRSFISKRGKLKW